MNALDNFRESMKPPSDATFLSSKGGGLLKALKNIANPPSVNYPQRKIYSKPMTSLTFFKPKPQPGDTLLADSLTLIKRDTLLQQPD
jgi:hypothetical protein